MVGIGQVRKADIYRGIVTGEELITERVGGAMDYGYKL